MKQRLEFFCTRHPYTILVYGGEISSTHYFDLFICLFVFFLFFFLFLFVFFGGGGGCGVVI